MFILVINVNHMQISVKKKKKYENTIYFLSDAHAQIKCTQEWKNQLSNVPFFYVKLPISPRYCHMNKCTCSKQPHIRLKESILRTDSPWSRRAAGRSLAADSLTVSALPLAVPHPKQTAFIPSFTDRDPLLLLLLPGFYSLLRRVS